MALTFIHLSSLILNMLGFIWVLSEKASRECVSSDLLWSTADMRIVQFQMILVWFFVLYQIISLPPNCCGNLYTSSLKQQQLIYFTIVITVTQQSLYSLGLTPCILLQRCGPLVSNDNQRKPSQEGLWVSQLELKMTPLLGLAACQPFSSQAKLTGPGHFRCPPGVNLLLPVLDHLELRPREGTELLWFTVTEKSRSSQIAYLN